MQHNHLYHDTDTPTITSLSISGANDKNSGYMGGIVQAINQKEYTGFLEGMTGALGFIFLPVQDLGFGNGLMSE
jgi:hypothetical protein